MSRDQLTHGAWGVGFDGTSLGWWPQGWDHQESTDMTCEVAPCDRQDMAMELDEVQLDRMAPWPTVQHYLDRIKRQAGCSA